MAGLRETTTYFFYLVSRKWNESGFRPPLCTYRLNWARRTYWGWWDEWDDTVYQTQDSKFEPWRSEAEHATSWSRRLPAILRFTRGQPRSGNRTPNSGVKGSGANLRAPALGFEKTLGGSHSGRVPRALKASVITKSARYAKQFKFSPTWSCVSQQRPTTSSGWKLLIFVWFSWVSFPK